MVVDESSEWPNERLYAWWQDAQARAIGRWLTYYDRLTLRYIRRYGLEAWRARMIKISP